MKKLILLFVFVISALQIYAQAENWYFSLSFGTSLPGGKFGETQTLDEESGFARKGFALTLDATYPLGSNWSAKGAVLLNSNSVNRAGMGTMLEQRMKAQSIVVTGDDRDYLTLQTNGWLSNNVMFGPVYSFNFNSFAWDIQLLGGLNVTQLPKQKLAYENPDNNWIYLQQNTSTSSVAFAYTAGTALRFAVTENINFKFGVDFFRAKAKQKYEELRITKENDGSSVQKLSEGAVSNKLQSISATIGLVYYL